GTTIDIVGTQGNDTITVSCARNEVLVSASGTGVPCSEMTFVSVDPRDSRDTVDLSRVDLAEFPQLDETSVDVHSDQLTGVVTGSEGRDVITADHHDTIDAGAGDDWIDGGESASGGPGDDTLRDVSGDVDGGPGDDRIVDPGSGSISGGDGHD